MLNFANLTLATKIDTVSYQVLKKVNNLLKFCSRLSKILVGILIIPVFSESGIQYLWQEEISVTY